jgi:hypothetical protein
MFIGLNPSTADETKNDPTVRRCIRFAKDWGYRELVMTNLFGWRDADPDGMKSADDPIGPGNNEALLALSGGAVLVVAAWGVHGSYRNRDRWAVENIPSMRCLGLTKDGFPRHPLYVKADVIPMRFCGGRWK